MKKTVQNILFTEAQVQAAVEQVSASVQVWLKKKGAKGLNVVSILEGARPFTRDLIGLLQRFAPDLKIELHEIQVRGTDGNRLLNERQWQKDQLDPKSFSLCPILLVDDLVDSGATLAAIKATLSHLGKQEVRTAVLVRKFGEKSGPVDFCGLELNWSDQTLAQKGLRDRWLFGYGMDNDGQYRDLHHIEVLDMRL